MTIALNEHQLFKDKDCTFR